MRLTIHHQTDYRYEIAPKHLTQVLRLSPRDEAHQRVVDWKVSTPGRCTPFRDAYGNVSHTHVVTAPASNLTILVAGTVDVQRLTEGALADDNVRHVVPPLAYSVPTLLTAGFSGITALANATLPHGLRRPVDALVLAAAICRVVEYQSGETDATSSAEQAFALGKGVCQDHAHLMIAACRALNVPARYVSGYVDSGNARAAASHAWADVWLGSQWTSVDVTNGQFASDQHCRLAIGRDTMDACPIRGVRDGGEEEVLDVTVVVRMSQ